MYDIIKHELGKYFKIVSNMWLPVLDSHRPRHDFSLKYKYNMKQTNNKKNLKISSRELLFDGIPSSQN